MQKQTFLLFIIVTIIFLFPSCAHRLVGTWQVTKYQVIDPGNAGESMQNIGEIQFKKNHTGEKRLNYSFMGQRITDDIPFRWTDYDGYIRIEGRGSDLEKTWIVAENKKKFQKWQATDNNRIQVLELKK